MNVSTIGWKDRRLHISVVLVISWLALIALAEWFYAAAETEPPEWDVLSYAGKALYFWNAIRRGEIVGLLDLPPSIGPQERC
jgi:hypothetical protein